MHNNLRALFFLSIGISLFAVLTPLGYCQTWINSVVVTTTNNTAVVTWGTAVPSSSQIRYGTSPDYGKHTNLDPTMVMAHSQTLTSLASATTYHFRLLSSDASGVAVTSLDCTFTTQAGPVAVTVTPTSATVPSGGTQQFSASVANSSNQSVTWSVTAGTVSSSGLFTAPVVSSTATVTLTATSVANNTASASATITVTPGSTLAANPASLAFANTQVGNSTNLSETLTNTGSSSVTISAANLAGSGFSISGLTLPTTLTAGQSVTFTATFTPTTSGSASGSLSVVSNAVNSPLSITLSGTGTASGQLAVSPTSLSFGSVTVGASASLSGTLTASGAPVTINGAGLTNSEFTLSGISLPVTLAAGQSTNFTVTFMPNASGATSASLSFSSNASNSPTVQSMTGTGTAAPQHTVSLTWNSSSGASGYNIYRGSVSGGPYTLINSSPDGTPSYTDSTVVSGQTYYYVTTAVNSESQESGYSNQAQAVVPTP